MSTHQSPDHHISSPIPGNVSPPQTPADTGFSQFRVTRVSIPARNFIVTLDISTDSAKPIDSVTVEIRSEQQAPIVTYRTDSVIPTSVAGEILDAYRSLADRLDPDQYRMVGSAATPETFLKDMVTLLERNFPAAWERTEPPPPPHMQGELPIFRPATPSLLEFAQRPSIIDEHLTATVATDQGMATLGILMKPDQGYMRCTLTLGSDSLEWKIPALIENRLDQEFLTADLSRKALDLFIRLRLDGADRVRDLLNDGHLKARTLPSNPSLTHQIDNNLSRGYLPAAERSASLQHSSATVSLQIGTRAAAIQIEPCPDDPSHTTTVVFGCPKGQRELDAFQMHHIQTTYTMLTSSSFHERLQGLMMCKPDRIDRKSPFSPEVFGDSADIGVEAVAALNISEWGPTPDLGEFVDPSTAQQIMALKDICVLPNGSDPSERVEIKLDGGREMAAVRAVPPRVNVDGHCFHTIRCIRLNDDSIRVALLNSIGGSYQGLITAAEIEGSGGHPIVIPALFEAFAASTGDRWMDVVGYIEELRGERGSDTERLGYDPTYQNIPPFEDRSGAEMIREGVKMGAFICARVDTRDTPMHGTIQYAGPGCVRVSFKRKATGPILEFVVKESILREVSLSRPSVPANEDGAPAVPLYRFRSEGIQIGSPTYIRIMQEAHNYALQVPLKFSRTFWNDELITMATPLTNLLSETMVCVHRTTGEVE